MTHNPILEEIYAAREKLLKNCGGDIHSYVLNARERALASGHPIADPKQRASRETGAMKVTVHEMEHQLPPPGHR